MVATTSKENGRLVHGRPTLELLQVYSLDVSTGQVLHVSEQGFGVGPRLFGKRRNQVLESRIMPRVASKFCETVERIRILLP